MAMPVLVRDADGALSPVVRRRKVGKGDNSQAARLGQGLQLADGVLHVPQDIPTAESPGWDQPASTPPSPAFGTGVQISRRWRDRRPGLEVGATGVQISEVGTARRPGFRRAGQDATRHLEGSPPMSALSFAATNPVALCQPDPSRVSAPSRIAAEPTIRTPPERRKGVRGLGNRDEGRVDHHARRGDRVRHPLGRRPACQLQSARPTPPACLALPCGPAGHDTQHRGRAPV